jgi:hypothetical protein
MSIENQPRASSVEDYLETERTHAWSKAYLVADSMRLRPDKLMAEAYVRVMFDCSMEMGHGFTRSIEVVNEINAWPEVHKCPTM